MLLRLPHMGGGVSEEDVFVVDSFPTWVGVFLSGLTPNQGPVFHMGGVFLCFHLAIVPPSSSPHGWGVSYSR